ncbi:hypothetical protein PsYK624_111520 [Phanerochaete sordida]|uniref:Uncharacterized protein n=1 Tax=Phanerochaete sordida TaxID=48140 RepID=A0A9P3LH50_9APHY|nr:hypothetical protein PsYK624_111520 [Phanerochaete sordida]
MRLTLFLCTVCVVLSVTLCGAKAASCNGELHLAPPPTTDPPTTTTENGKVSLRANILDAEDASSDSASGSRGMASLMDGVHSIRGMHSLVVALVYALRMRRLAQPAGSNALGFT